MSVKGGALCAACAGVVAPIHDEKCATRSLVACVMFADDALYDLICVKFLKGMSLS